MKLIKCNLSCARGMRLLAVGLLTTGIDILLFHFLYLQANSLAFAHLTSFFAASIIGWLSIGLWPLREASHQSEPNHFSFKSLAAFILLALLVVLLRGGLLASLIQIMAVPAIAAISISAVISAGLLYAGYFYTRHASNLPAEIRWDYFCLAVVAYIISLKLFYLGLPELIFEEAYYWNYAQHLDIGYLDHPLMVAWIIKTFISILGNIEFAVRFGAFLCWFVTAYFVYKLAREILNLSSAYWALVLIATLPAYLSFGWFMSPDAPLTACWAAAIYYTHQAILRDNKKAWLGVGIALGLGIISKYTIVLLGAAIVLFLLSDRRSRKWLRRPEPYIAVAITCILFSPVIIWNMQHEWASIAFQSQGRVKSGYSFSLPRLISNVVIFLTPTGLLSVIAIVLSRRTILSRFQASMGSNNQSGDTVNRSYLLLAWLTLFPVFVFATLSLFRASKLNWTGPFWLGLIPFIALLITQKPIAGTPKLLAWSQRAWPATIVILLLAYSAAFHYLSLGFPKTPYPQNVHLMGWQGFGRDIEAIVSKLERETGEKILVVGLDRNKIASGLAFYRANYLALSNEKPAAHIPAFQTASVHLFGGNGLMYELWFPIEKQSNQAMLLVSEEMNDLTNDRVLSRVKVAGAIQEIKTQKNGKQTGTYYYRLVKGYQGKSIVNKVDISTSND